MKHHSSLQGRHKSKCWMTSASRKRAKAIAEAMFRSQPPKLMQLNYVLQTVLDAFWANIAKWFRPNAAENM